MINLRFNSLMNLLSSSSSEILSLSYINRSQHLSNSNLNGIHRTHQFDNPAPLPPSNHLLALIPILIIIILVVAISHHSQYHTPFKKSHNPPSALSPQPEGLNKSTVNPTPILYNCITSHCRTYPKQHIFSYKYMLTGFPIDLQESIGRTISYGKPEKARRTIFSVEPDSYLYPGPGTLREKLNVVLQERVRSEFRKLWFVLADIPPGP